ncbi:MAG: hypothetical protein LBI37_02270, partial [Puniceicoccales bacterium]|nr:hypothetical protein [Puniceicoccales bacterium]
MSSGVSIWKKLINAIFIIIYLSSVLLLALMLSLNLWLPNAIKIYSTYRLGFPIIVKKSRCNIFKGIIDFRDLTIQNPKNRFAYIDLANFDSIYGKFSPIQIVKKSMIIDNITLNIRELWISRHPISISNMEIFIDKLTKSNDEKIAKINEANEEKYSCNFVAQTVIIRIKTINFLNFSKGKKDNKEFNINYSKKFHNVSSWEEIVKQIQSDFYAYGGGYLISSFLSSMAKAPELNMVTSAVKFINGFFQKTINGMVEAAKSSIQMPNIELNPSDKSITELQKLYET